MFFGLNFDHFSGLRSRVIVTRPDCRSSRSKTQTRATRIESRGCGRRCAKCKRPPLPPFVERKKKRSRKICGAWTATETSSGFLIDSFENQSGRPRSVARIAPILTGVDNHSAQARRTPRIALSCSTLTSIGFVFPHDPREVDRSATIRYRGHSHTIILHTLMNIYFRSRKYYESHKIDE